MTYTLRKQKPALPYAIEIIECRSDGLTAKSAAWPRLSVGCKNVLAALALLALVSIIDPGPLPSPASSLTVASWYGPGFNGRRTASGERFDQWAMTAAHRTLPFGTLVKVTHKGRSVVVRINDRGPFIRGRHLDLSRGAAKRIGCSGVCKVRMSVLGRRG